MGDAGRTQPRRRRARTGQEASAVVGSSSDSYTATAAGGSAAAASAPCLPSRLPLDRLALLGGTLSQVTVLLAQGGKAQGTSSWERLQPVLVLAVWLVELLLAVCWGALYARHRGAWVAAFRLAHFSLPSYRHTGVGAALVMTAPPRPGTWGAASDTFRLLTGTRLVSLAMQSAFLLLDPAPTLAMQAALLCLVLNPRAYCSLPLLRHPLFQRRLAFVAAALEVATLPAESLMLFAGHSSSTAALMTGRARPEAVCRATLAWVQVLVGLLPFFLSLHWWRPGSQRPAGEAAGSEAAWEGGATPPQGPAECCGWSAGGLSARCSAALHRLFCPQSPRDAGKLCAGRGMLAGYLLCLYLWTACKRVAGLG
ncbi:hypothetical protein ABPG77_008590 [Micractinium sp. CCAP 211/92]